MNFTSSGSAVRTANNAPQSASLFASNSTRITRNQPRHATHAINANDENLDNNILLIEDHMTDSHDNDGRNNSSHDTAAVISRIMASDKNNYPVISSTTPLPDKPAAVSNKSHYNQITSNIPDSRYTVKKWFIHHPQRQTELINLFIDQLTWTNHLNFTEAIKMLRCNFDFPFSGARVLKRQYSSIMRDLEKKIKEGAELDEFDLLVATLRDKKRECEDHKNRQAQKRKQKLERYALVQGSGGLVQGAEADSLTRSNNPIEANHLTRSNNPIEANNMSRSHSSLEANNLSRSHSSLEAHDLSRSQSPNKETPAGTNFSETILKSIQQQIHTTFSGAPPHYSGPKEKRDEPELALLKARIGSLEAEIAVLKQSNEKYRALLAEKDAYIKTKDASYMKVVDSLLALQHEYQSALKDVFSKP